VVLQVQLNVQEASAGGVIASLAVSAVTGGAVFLLIIDIVAIKSSIALLIKNILTIRAI
jgi:hypothetical protein